MDDWFESMVTKVLYRRWNGKERMTDEDVRTLGARMLEKAEAATGKDSPLYRETAAFIEARATGQPYDAMRLTLAEAQGRHPSRARREERPAGSM